MSWPQWPQPQAASNPAVAPLISTTPSLGQGFAHSSAIPPPPMSYTPTQYAAMSAEQQYAIQQWQNYHQQYAQWHAQYGEQYQREMQAKLGINAPAIPYMPSVPQFLPQPSVSGGVPLINAATSFNMPPPSIQLPSQPPPPPPPPPESDSETLTEENTHSKVQHSSPKFSQNTDPVQISKVNVLAGFVRESNEVNIFKGNQSVQNKPEQNGKSGNWNREGSTPWQQQKNQDFHERPLNQQQKFQTDNRPFNDRINDRKNFGGNNNRFEGSGYNKRKVCEENLSLDSHNQQGNENLHENHKLNQPQPSAEEDSEDKTPEEKAFDEQFQKWEEEFENWKKQNANHPDKRAYREYEMKFEDCRKKLLERREIMKKRKLERRFQEQKRSHPYETSQRNRQESSKFPAHDDENISNLKRNSLVTTGENQREKEDFITNNNTPVSVNITTTENVNLNDGKSNEINSETYKNREANMHEKVESIKDTKSIREKPELCEPQLNEESLDFLQGSKKAGGIPGLDLLPEEITRDNQSENNPIDEEVTEVIDLEIDSKLTETSNDHIRSNIKDTEIGKKEIPSLFAQKIEKPDLSPPISKREDNDFLPYKQNKFEDSTFSQVQDSSNKRYDEMNALTRKDNLLKPEETNATRSDGNVAMLSELANALSDPNVLALLNALSNTNNAGASNPQQAQPQNNISPWLPGQQPFGARPLLDEQPRNVNIFDAQNQNSQSGAGNLWQNNQNSLAGQRFDNKNVPWATGGFEGTRRNYENIFDKSFNENRSENINIENDHRSFKDIRNIFDRNAECDKNNKRNIEMHRRNFDTNRNRNPWNNNQLKDDDWGNNNKRGSNLNRNLEIISESSQGSDRFSDRGRDNESNSRDRDNASIGRQFERGNKRNSRDRNKRANLINNRDRSRSSGQQNEDMNSSQMDSHRNPFLSEPRTSDDYFRPAHVIDYQNKSLGGNSAFSGNNFRRNDILLPTKVVDYGHKPSNNFSAGNRTGFSKNVESTNSNSDEFFPMKTIDYGHASAKSTEINNSNKNSNSNNNRNFSDNFNNNNKKYNKPKWNAKNTREGNQNDTRLDQHLGDRKVDDRRNRIGQNNELEASTLKMEYNKEKSFPQFSECSTTAKHPEKHVNDDDFFTENIEDSDIDFTKDDFTEFSPKKQSPLRAVSPENQLIDEEREDSRENEEQLEEISEDDEDFNYGTTFKPSSETNAFRSTSNNEQKGFLENDSKFQEFESENNSDKLKYPFMSSSLSVGNNKTGSFFNFSHNNEKDNSFYPTPDSRNMNSSILPSSSLSSFPSSNIFDEINNSSDSNVFSQENKTKLKNTQLIDEILLKPGRNVRPKKIVIILRGPPGSGKSHIAKLIKEKEIEMGGSAPRLLSIDDYFMIENDKEEKCPKTGRKLLTKEMIYEYEPEMEESYFQYLLKAYKKTINDRLFDIIIVDCCNYKLKTLREFYDIAKDARFSPFVIDLLCDIETCLSHNIHNRKKQDIEKIITEWSTTPEHYMKLDCTKLLQSAAIQEVEMIDVSDIEDEIQIETEIKNDDPIEGGTFLRSKWDTDPTEEKLARLDGTNKPLQKRATTLEDYLQMDGWEPSPSNSTNKKRVRWADIEEKREQDKMRAIGFVVGQTDWKRMMDPTGGSSALTKTKYIERIKKNK